MNDKGEWNKAVEPITRKLKMAAMLNMHYTFNPVGVKELAGLLEEMARVIDEEITARANAGRK